MPLSRAQSRRRTDGSVTKPCKQRGQPVCVLGPLPGWHRGPAPGASKRGQGAGASRLGGGVAPRRGLWILFPEPRFVPHGKIWSRGVATLGWHHEKLTAENGSPGPLAPGGICCPPRPGGTWDRLSRDAGHSWVSVGGMERLRAKGTGQGSDPRAGELGHDLDLAPKFNPVNFQPSGSCGGTCGRCLWGEQAGRREVATVRVPEAAQSHLGAPLLLLKWPELSLPLNSLKT